MKRNGAKGFGRPLAKYGDSSSQFAQRTTNSRRIFRDEAWTQLLSAVRDA